MNFARIDQTLLHYRIAGREGAPALVFINSLGTDARIWDELIALFSDRYRCLSYDKRGHGLSDAPAGPYGLDDHLADVVGLVSQAQIERAVVVGVSVGGLIGQGLGISAPSWLKGLVLCDTAPKIGDEALWNARIADVSERGMSAIADATMERWFSPGYRGARPDELAGWRNMLLRADAAGYAATCATLRDTDLRSAIARIEVPTLVVAGDADLATPPDLVRETAAAIPDARFAVMAGVGHIPSIEQPLQLAGLIDSFLKEIGHD